MEDNDRILTPRNRVFEQKLAFGKNNPNRMSTTSTSVYRITKMDQVEDILNCGYVRPKEGTNKGGHKNEIFWTRGGENLFYYNGGVILEAPSSKVKNNQVGAIPFDDLIGIWIFDINQNRYINNIDYFRDLYNQNNNYKEHKTR